MEISTSPITIMARGRGWKRVIPWGTCEIESDTLPTAPPQFWEELKAKNWVRLADERGAPIRPDALGIAIYRKSKVERLSTDEARLSTTKSDGMWV